VAGFAPALRLPACGKRASALFQHRSPCLLTLWRRGRFFGNMEMRGFAQRSHERKIMGAKSHPFTGWHGPPKITKNEVAAARSPSCQPRVSARLDGGGCRSLCCASHCYVCARSAAAR
jgi:hypothetical protein